MDIRKIAGIITAIIGLGVLIGALNSGMPTPILQQPIEAYFGIVFSIAWITGAPIWLACILAAFVLVLIALAFYKLGSWIAKLVLGKK